MPRQKIGNWTAASQMCLTRFPWKPSEKVDMMAMELARKHAEDEVATFERDGEVAQQALAELFKAATQ
jgi:hypothetical protein